MGCRWKPCWVLIDDTVKKAYFEDWQLLKDGQNYNPVEDSTQTIPCAADSSKLRSTENSDRALKYEQKRDSGEDNLQTSPKTTESAKLLKSGSNGVNFKHEQPWDPRDISSLPKSLWQAVGEPDAPTWKLSGTQGTAAFWEKSEAPVPFQKTREQLSSPKTA